MIRGEYWDAIGGEIWASLISMNRSGVIKSPTVRPNKWLVRHFLDHADWNSRPEIHKWESLSYKGCQNTSWAPTILVNGVTPRMLVRLRKTLHVQFFWFAQWNVSEPVFLPFQRNMLVWFQWCNPYNASTHINCRVLEVGGCSRGGQTGNLTDSYGRLGNLGED